MNFQVLVAYILIKERAIIQKNSYMILENNPLD